MNFDVVGQSGLEIQPDLFIHFCNSLVTDPKQLESIYSDFYQKREDFLQITIYLFENIGPEQKIALFYLFDALKKYVHTYWDIHNQELRQFYEIFKEKLFCYLDSNINALDRVVYTKIGESLLFIAFKEWPKIWPDFMEVLFAQLFKSENHTIFVLLTLNNMMEYIEKNPRELAICRSTYDSLEASITSYSAKILKILSQILVEPHESSLLQRNELALKLFCQVIPRIDATILFRNLEFIETMINNFFVVRELVFYVIEFLGELVSSCNIPEEFYNDLGAVFVRFCQLCSNFLDEKTIADPPQSLSNLLVSHFPAFIDQYNEIFQEGEFSEQLSQALNWIFLYTKHTDDKGDFLELLKFWAWNIKQIVYEKTSSFGGTSYSSFHLYEPFFTPLIQVVIEKFISPYDIERYEDGGYKLINNNEFGSDFNAFSDILSTLVKIRRSIVIDELILLRNTINNDFSIEKMLSFCWSFGSICQSLNIMNDVQLVISSVEFIMNIFNSVENSMKVPVAVGFCFVASQIHNFMSRNPGLFNQVSQIVLQFFSLDDTDLKMAAVESLISFLRYNRDYVIKNEEIFNDFIKIFSNIIKEVPSESAKKFIKLFSELAHSNFVNSDVNDKIVDVILSQLKSLMDKALSVFNPQNPELLHESLELIAKSTAGSSLMSKYFKIFAPFVDPIFDATEKLVSFSNQELSNSESYIDSNICKLHIRFFNTIALFLESLLCTGYSATDVEFFGSFFNRYVELINNTDPTLRPKTFYSILGVIILKNNNFPDIIKDVYANILRPSIYIVSKDYVSYTEIRTPLIILISSIISTSSESILSLEPSEIEYIHDFIQFSCNSVDQELSKESFKAYNLLISFVIDKSPEKFRDSFFDGLLPHILEFIFRNMTDLNHKHCFELQANLVRKLFSLPHTAKIKDNILTGLVELFPNCNPEVTSNCIINIFNAANDINTSIYSFYETVADLLVAVTQISRLDKNLHLTKLNNELEKLKQIDEKVKDLPSGDL